MATPRQTRAKVRKSRANAKKVREAVKRKAKAEIAGLPKEYRKGGLKHSNVKPKTEPRKPKLLRRYAKLGLKLKSRRLTATGNAAR